MTSTGAESRDRLAATTARSRRLIAVLRFVRLAERLRHGEADAGTGRFPSDDPPSARRRSRPSVW